MQESHRHRTQNMRRAFALAETVMLALALGVAASVPLAMSAKARSATGLNRDLGNLRQIGQWTRSFATDNDDAYPMLSEAPNSQWPELRPLPGDDLRNGAKHAIDIIRRRTGREDFPLPANWIAHILYGHLALADYTGRRLPDRTWVSVGGVHRMNWTNDPENKFDQGFWQPFQPPQGGGAPSPTERRWPYSSSYQTPPAWYDHGQSDWKSPVLGRIAPSSNNAYIIPPSVQLGGQPLSLTAFPSQKVMVHDAGDWHHARRPRYFAHQDRSTGETARVAIALADGAAGVGATSDANPGWQPLNPTSGEPALYSYAPRLWEPLTLNGEPSEVISGGVYRWTRGGLLGRDFGGAEIDTGQH